jgi:hypothetical protein
MRFRFSPEETPESIDQIIFQGFRKEWQMSAAERCALIMLLEQIRPECAIEIGTAQGGSLSVLSHFANKVYSLDVDPTCRDRLDREFTNVEFIIGRSQDTLSPLLRRLQESGTQIGLILIDGDHTAEGLRQDIELVIVLKPTQPLFIVMHDSFNPDCRAGILGANWESSPYVHLVEVDFVPGIFNSYQEVFRQMWGGLALAIMLARERKNELKIQASQELLFRTVLPHSVHSPTPPLLNRVRSMKIVKYVLENPSLRQLGKNAWTKIQRIP